MSKLEYDGEFRSRWFNRREKARELVARAISGGCVEWELDRLKDASGYDRLNTKDQANFRRFSSDVRAIVSGWQTLDARERKRFLDGSLVYSTLLKRMRESAG